MGHRPSNTQTHNKANYSMCQYVIGECLDSSVCGLSRYAALDSLTGQQKVITAIPKEHEHVSRAQLKREVTLMRALGSHPNLASVERVLHSAARIYAVTDSRWHGCSDSLDFMQQQGPQQRLTAATAQHCAACNSLLYICDARVYRRHEKQVAIQSVGRGSSTSRNPLTHRVRIIWIPG